MAMRIGLFVGTNLAVMFVLNIILTVLGLTGPDSNWLPFIIMAGVLGMAGSLISLLMSKKMALRSSGAQIIETPTTDLERWLTATVAAQAEAAGIGKPAIAIFPSSAPNAFATGANKNASLVAVSTGLLESMSEDEAAAVLAHEVSHIANGDMVTLSLIQGVVNVFVIVLSRVIGHTVDRVVFKTERGYGPAYLVTTIVAQLLIGILASIVVFWFSRQREFRADAGGARLAGANKMVAALEALKRGASDPLPESVAAFGISGGGGIAKLFSTHPPLDERIERLRAMGG